MSDENTDLTAIVTRGFAGLHSQIRERDDKVTQLSEKMIGVEFKIDQLKETLAKVEIEMDKAGNARLNFRLDVLEECNKDFKKKQDENARWIKGLIASVIILLLGFLFNLIKSGGIK